MVEFGSFPRPTRLNNVTKSCKGLSTTTFLCARMRENRQDNTLQDIMDCQQGQDGCPNIKARLDISMYSIRIEYLVWPMIQEKLKHPLKSQMRFA